MKSTILDLIILKGGVSSINGIVLTQNFVLKTGWGNLNFSKSQILEIHYRNPPTILRDTILVSQAGTRLEGDLYPDPIRVDIDGTGQVVAIPKKDMISIVLLTNHPLGKLSRKTRKALTPR
jgi:hypothetical protein